MKCQVGVILANKGENWRLFVYFVEDYAQGVIGRSDKLYAHALECKPDLR